MKGLVYDIGTSNINTAQRPEIKMKSKIEAYYLFVTLFSQSSYRIVTFCLMLEIMAIVNDNEKQSKENEKTNQFQQTCLGKNTPTALHFADMSVMHGVMALQIVRISDRCGSAVACWRQIAKDGMSSTG